jgi:hypothetical protein
MSTKESGTRQTMSVRIPARTRLPRLPGCDMQRFVQLVAKRCSPMRPVARV